MSQPGMGAAELHGFDRAETPREPHEFGVTEITSLSDSEKLTEILYYMRTVGLVMADMQKVGPMGMIKAMMSGNGK